jgi:hypothetical protein
MKNEMKQNEKEMRQKNHDGVLGGKKENPRRNARFSRVLPFCLSLF